MLILFFWLLMLVPAQAAVETICASSAVILCENFEDRSTGSAPSTITPDGAGKIPAWAVSNASMDVVNTQAFDGVNSLQWTYPAGSDGAGYFDASLTQRNDCGGILHATTGEELGSTDD